MIQPQTQTAQYWGSDFTITDDDIEQIYNHLIEVERPQTAEQIARVIIQHRVTSEMQQVERMLSGRELYQPQNSYEAGTKLVFPALKYAHGQVTAVRPGYNPQYGEFKVLAVEINGKSREFAAEFTGDHALNVDEAEGAAAIFPDVDVDELFRLYGRLVVNKLTASMQKRDEFVRLANLWFVKGLLAEVNIGHLHLAEAVLEMSGGGPLKTEEIVPHLDMDETLDPSVLRFSLDYKLLQDDRFDEVAPKNQVAWYLRRLEPPEVQQTPERLVYTPIPHDRALLSPQLLMLENELDDEWSDLEASEAGQPVVFSLLFPHRWAGTIPITSRIRPLLPIGRSPRQLITLVDEFSNEEIEGWIVQEGRYIYGLSDWYEQNGIPIGGFVHLQPGPESGVLILGYDRRRAQREWVRLATVVDNRIQFELMKRSISCGYDDLLVVGTDVTAAIDALWRRAMNNQRTIASLLAELFVPLAELTPQNAVHAKTLYSAMNMLRRVPPGPLFAELVKHPAFQPVGDHYWQFDRARWQDAYG